MEEINMHKIEQHRGKSVEECTCLKRSLSAELLTDTFSSCAYASSQASL